MSNFILKCSLISSYRLMALCFKGCDLNFIDTEAACPWLHVYCISEYVYIQSGREYSCI